MNLKFFFQFIKQVERITPLTVHLVDEDDDRRIAHATHLHQFPGLCFNTLGRVDHNDGRVDSRQRAVSIFGKVLVTRCVEDVHLVIQIIKFHDGGRDRNTSLFLNIHPVGGGCFPNLIAFHSTCHLNLSSKKQEFLRECSLSRIGMRNDGKGASAFYFVH